MPNTRKKIIKTVYKDDNSEAETGDFSDSGSEAKISEESMTSSDEENEECDLSSGNEYKNNRQKNSKPRPKKKPQFAKTFINKISQNVNRSSISTQQDTEDSIVKFSVKDLTESDKLLPSVLDLSESDSSDDESSTATNTKKISKYVPEIQDDSNSSNNEQKMEYKDVFTTNLKDSEEIARKAFLELELQKNKIEETKASIRNFVVKQDNEKESDVNDLLAQGEEDFSFTSDKKKNKRRKAKDDSDSDMEDWEEVKECKSIPQQGLQLIVDIPDLVCRKTKKVDVEMMMKRKINRVKKEYQVYMHKVHVLCWLGHGNYVSRVLNDQEVMTTVLALVPSKNCYPGERVDMKYIEQVTAWYKDKITIKQDKNEDKYRPKAPPLKIILMEQIKKRIVTTKKYAAFIFIAMLRALGLQCRVMFNFVTVPLKPPSSELCSLSTKPKEEKKNKSACEKKLAVKPECKNIEKVKANPINKKVKSKLPQLDGTYDSDLLSDTDYENIIQLDGSDDMLSVQTRKTRASNAKKIKADDTSNQDVSPPKKPRKSPSPKTAKSIPTEHTDKIKPSSQSNSESPCKSSNDKFNLSSIKNQEQNDGIMDRKLGADQLSTRKTRNSKKTACLNNSKLDTEKLSNKFPNNSVISKPTVVVSSHEEEHEVSSKYFESNDNIEDINKHRSSRKRSQTTQHSALQKSVDMKVKSKPNSRTKSAPGNTLEKSKYFSDSDEKTPNNKKSRLCLQRKRIQDDIAEDKNRVSHKDLVKAKTKLKNDVTTDLVNIIKNRVKEAKEESIKGIVKGKIKNNELDEDSDFLPEEDPKNEYPDSDEDFKPTKISPKPSTSRKPSTTRKIDRRVLSSDEENSKNKVDVWCEVYVEELEQWICVDVISGKLHCPELIYRQATHPVCYVVGWDNNNYLKDVTRRYVPHWNTVTRKQRAEPVWWNTAIQPWIGPKTARDREEDQYLDKMQSEAPLPKSIAEYKNHPLYALKRHLLKFEAIYPPDAATLGFVRGEPVYARDCVYTCRSRDTWLKEAKVVRLGEQPYKVVKARPKWDKLSNKLITDKPLEVFGPWQVQDYEPPTAENGIVPRNAYGNVELFKDCMLPKGTVHVKLPGLNKIARKLNIDCAPAMTGFDFNGGWSHPVYDGFVVCKEFEEIVTEAWLKDQEEQERKEREKIEARVYGNWRRLIKGLFIRERLKCKYGFEDPTTSQDSKAKKKGPRLVVKKK